MGQKIKKPHRRAQSKKETFSSGRSWPNLPPSLLGLIRRNPALMQNMSFGGVSKSWRTVWSRCNSNASSLPQFQLSEINEGHNRNTEQLIESFSLDTADPRVLYERRFFRCRISWKFIVGHSQDMLVTRMKDFSDIRLVGSSKIGYCSLPPWDVNDPFKLAFMSSPLQENWNGKENCAIMVLTGMTHPAFAFYTFPPYEAVHKWVKQDSTLIDPNSAVITNQNNYMRFTNAIGMKGKFYALSLQGTLAVIEYTDSHPRIVDLCRNRAVPTNPCRHFREYLVDFGGGILLVVLLISQRSAVGSVDDVEMFKLDEEGKLSWVKMENLGDRTLFVGKNCCISVPASELGCKRNCVYFDLKEDDSWWMYDVGKGSISSTADDMFYNYE